MRKLLRSGFILAAILILAASATVFWITGPNNVAENTFVEIARGTSTRAIADQLTEQGVIRTPYALIAVRLLRPGSKLQAGEYEFTGALTAWQVFDRIQSGKVFYEEVTIPEGSNIYDIATLLGKTDAIGAQPFLLAAKDPSSVRDLDPAAPTLEGFLFPSTYRVTHQTTARELCRMMTEEFRRQWKSLSGGKTGHEPSDVHRVVTLASLVEKESALPKERPLVAAVFDDRLKVGMRLQCDPTAVYAALIENRYRGTIYKSDLTSDNAFNTYVHNGLPPGPIANPGLESLKAALHPAQTKALYFVARGDGSGSHYFSETLTQHNLAVSQYRKSQH